eukprot:gb/GECH01006263.1/.p1 GENE.gb/GECH01006263.1/~~gb/GECH01006263.1/.p1  ORF type:complete len:549 (+),score=116.52 gb/GECH01006263.1/:1-1647(+)
MPDLPLVPGNNFDDTVFRDNHNLRHTFDYRGGSRVVNDPVKVEKPKMSTLRETLKQKTDTEDGEPPPPQYQSLDRKVLRFYAYFKEPVHESPDEQQRVRKCRIYYFLEDDTLEIVEPRQDNSGLCQGVMMRRHRVPKEGCEADYILMDDLNVGAEVTIYGKTFRLVDCDQFTREFLEGLGVEVGEPETYPGDQHTFLRDSIKASMVPKTILNPEDKELKRFHEYSAKGRHTNPSVNEREKVKKFLANDRKVLRFYAYWDDSKSLYGDFRQFTIHYYLSTDEMSVNERYPTNSGRDPFPTFVTRSQIPKPTQYSNSDEDSGFYTDADLGIGNRIVVFGREFVLYDCDDFTRKYYQEQYGMSDEDMEPMEVPSSQPKKSGSKMPTPPHTGFGSEEDALGSWKYLEPKPPKKDIKKYMEFDKINLRFSAEMLSNSPEDQGRKFTLTYYLSNDTVSIFEPTIRNSGIVGGKFLKRQRVKIPDGTRYLEPTDFMPGNTVEIYKHRFKVLEMDNFTAKFFEKYPDGTPPKNAQGLTLTFKNQEELDNAHNFGDN